MREVDKVIYRPAELTLQMLVDASTYEAGVFPHSIGELKGGWLEGL